MASSGNRAHEEYLTAQLKGNTLRVYIYVLKSTGKVGVREVQRALRFSSPTLAVYHLDKLVELGLLEKRCGEYYLLKEVKVGVLRQFVRVGAFVLPRHLFYATLFTTLLILYAVYSLSFEQIGLTSAFALVFGILGTVTSWFETMRAWREKV
jgi:predicted DNA-binding transcriptional regulator